MTQAPRIRMMGGVLVLLGLRGGAALGAATPPPRPIDVLPQCPQGTELKVINYSKSSSAYCHVVGGREKHGPWVDYFPSGSRKTAGLYVHDLQHGLWKEWDENGKAIASVHYWHGKRGEEVADGDRLCPAGSSRVRDDPFSGEEECLTLDARGRPIREGPTVEHDWLSRSTRKPLQWDRPGRYLGPGMDLPPGPPSEPWIVQSTTYHLGRKDGVERFWFAPGQLALEVNSHDDLFDGLAATWYRNGNLREQVAFRGGKMAGERTYWRPDGQVRWHAHYEDGRRVAVNGDLTLEGRPCWEGSLPVTSADGLYGKCDANEPLLDRGFESFPGDKNAGFPLGSWEALAPNPAAGAKGPIVARGVLAFDGRTLPALSTRDAFLEIAAAFGPASPEVRYQGGELQISGLGPGRYFVCLTAGGENGSRPGTPGAFEGYLVFDLLPKQVASLRIDVQKIMHLRQPGDNVRGIFGIDFFPHPLHFAWESFGPGVAYEYVVIEGERLKRHLVGSGRTLSTEVMVDLPPNRGDDEDEFYLGAFRGDHYIGRLMVQDSSPTPSHNEAYRFRVR